MRIHLHLPRLASCLFWPIAKSGFTLNPEYYLMKHLGNFVEPGASVLGVAGHWAGNAIAFRNPNGTVICLVRNPFQEKKRVLVALGPLRVTVMFSPASFNTLVLPRQAVPKRASGLVGF